MPSRALRSPWIVLVLFTLLITAHTAWSRHADQAVRAQMQQTLDIGRYPVSTRASIARTLQPARPDYLNLGIFILSVSAGMVGLNRLRAQHADTRVLGALRIFVAVLCVGVFLLRFDAARMNLLLHAAELVLASALVLSYTLPARHDAHQI